MEFKGTGGTWSVSGENYFTIESKVQHERHTVPIVTVATINSSFRPTEESKANAKLISKAPALLEEVKHLVKALKTISSFGATRPIIEHAEQLIKEILE